MVTPERDEVDQIVGAWTTVRPDLDTAPLEVLSRISRLARLLEQARAATFAQHSLDSWEFDVLSALRRAGRPFELSPGALIQQTLVTSGTMTNRVDRLIDRGLVSRRPDPDDRRGVLVALEPRGVQVVDAAMADLLTWEHGRLATLPARDQERLATGLRRLLGAIEKA